MDATVARPVAVGFNCVPPPLIAPLLRRFSAACAAFPLMCYPNGARWEASTNTWHPYGGKDDWERDVAEWRAAGAVFIGGCCCVSPATISLIRGIVATQ